MSMYNELLEPSGQNRQKKQSMGVCSLQCGTLFIPNPHYTIIFILQFYLFIDLFMLILKNTLDNESIHNTLP